MAGLFQEEAINTFSPRVTDFLLVPEVVRICVFGRTYDILFTC